MSNVNSREAILTAASTMYAMRGYEAVSMRDVAGEVNIKPASLYYHFKDKEALIREALSHVFAEKTAPMEGVLQAGTSPQQRFEAFIAWFVHLIFEDAVFSRLLTRELLDGTADRLEYLSKAVFDRPFSLLTQTISELSGNRDCAVTAMSVVSMILGQYHLARALPYLSGGRSEYGTPEFLVRHFTNVLGQAVKGDSLGGDAS